MMRTLACCVAMAVTVSSVAAQAPHPFGVSEAWRVDAAAANLTRITMMAVTRQGDLLVGQPDDKLVRVFGADGRIKSFGRDGQGPGEFRNVTRLGFLGDSIWVIDPTVSRIQLFGPDYKFIRILPQPPTLTNMMSPNHGVATVFAQAILPDGNFRVVASPLRDVTPPPWLAGIDTGGAGLFVMAASGQVLGRIATIPASRCQVLFPLGKGGQAAVQVPFCAERRGTEWDGSVPVAEVLQDEDLLAKKQYVLRLYAADGHRLFQRAVPFAPVSVTDDDIKAFEARRQDIYRNVPGYLATAPHPAPRKIFPPVRNVLAGRDNSVWVEERTGSKDHSWRVFDVRGTQLGIVTVPASVELRVVGVSAAWGIDTDADGEQSLVRYRLTRPK